MIYKHPSTCSSSTPNPASNTVLHIQSAETQCQPASTAINPCSQTHSHSMSQPQTESCTRLTSEHCASHHDSSTECERQSIPKFSKGNSQSPANSPVVKSFTLPIAPDSAATASVRMASLPVTSGMGTSATTPISSNILDLSAFINSDAIMNEPLDLSTPTSREDVTLASSLASSSTSSSDSSFSPPVMDTELARAALLAVSTGSVTPLIKEELRCTIQKKRLSSGQDELEVTYEEPEPSKLTAEDELKRVRRRERNRLAAQRCRSKRKVKADSLNAETEQLERANSRLRDEIADLERQLSDLRAMINRHDVLPSHCKTKLSVSEEEDDEEVMKPMEIVCDLLDEVIEVNECHVEQEQTLNHY